MIVVDTAKMNVMQKPTKQVWKLDGGLFSDTIEQ